MSSSVTGTASKPMLEYEVLFFQRSNKVHKSKGVSKFDGLLTINVATGAIRLQDSACVESDNDHEVSSDDDDDDDDDGGGNKRKKKQSYAKKQKQQRKKKTNSISYSGTDKSLAQRAEQSLTDDETVVLGGFQVQIVSCRSHSRVGVGTTMLLKPKVNQAMQQCQTLRRPALGLVSNQSSSLSSNPTRMMKQRTFVAKPLKSVVKAAPAPVANNAAPKVSIITGTQRLLKRKPLLPAVQQPSKLAPLHPRPPTTASLESRSQQQQQQQQSQSTRSGSTTESTVCPGIHLTGQIRNVLRPHQVEGVEFLWKALVTSPEKGAILADEMGLGKTLMTIATIIGLHRKNRDKHFVVVCPSSLVGNWAKEFDKWVGKASQPKRVVIQSGNDESISRLKATYSSTRSMGGQVLILSFELFRRVTQNIQQSIGLLVIDEAHKIKNQGSRIFSALAAIPCEARLIVTATPVQNNLKEFYTLANFVRPGILGELSSFRRDFEKPITAANHKSATRQQKLSGEEQSRALDALIKPFMLRRLAKDTIQKELPPQEQVLLFCRPTQTQAKMYREICRKATGAGTEALTALLDLRKICTHPGLLEKRDSYMKLSSSSVTLSGKFCVLEALLLALRDEGDKVVIVSNFTSVLSLVEATILRPKQLSFVRLDGSTDQSDRQALVDNFNRPNSSVFAFLLSSRAGGCGLTLTGANRLVMVDCDWNPATDKQAAARIHRPGQTKPCHIYRMFTTGTVEEVILQRQITKEALGVLDNSKSSDKFNPEEVADCFALKECDCDTKKKLGPSWPDYDGPGSLVEQGSKDQVLLNVAETLSGVLSHVHIVGEKEDAVLKVEDCHGGDEEGSRDEEMEF